jgi:hypothetical protein
MDASSRCWYPDIPPGGDVSRPATSDGTNTLRHAGYAGKAKPAKPGKEFGNA